MYQVYPRSFADANGDGTGDVEGIRGRLRYLRDLGIDAIWISPWYPSPLNDGGYDVADYREIDPRYGSTAEAEAFIAEAAVRIKYGDMAEADALLAKVSVQQPNNPAIPYRQE